MSTYLDSRNPIKHADYTDCPALAIQFLRDSETIRGLSPRTVNGYYIDLRIFFRFWKQHHGLCPSNVEFDDIGIQDISLQDLKSITTTDIYEFLHYTLRVRENSPSARARKLSALKSFFKYLSGKLKLIDSNPADEIDMPIQRKSLPKYLSLQEGMQLLENLSSDFPQRDYCILLLLLSCGMRLSELIAINRSDLSSDQSIRIIGKGNKERMIYLNQVCVQAVQELEQTLQQIPRLKNEPALFVSLRTGRRLSARRVQQIVENAFRTAGLDGKGYSVHKLRHTAATLMYQEGAVDMLTLKEILGHAHTSTTEIYTHLGNRELRAAADASPFAKVKKKSYLQKMEQSTAPELPASNTKSTKLPE